MATDAVTRFVLACRARGLDWEITGGCWGARCSAWLSGGGPTIVSAKGATRYEACAKAADELAVVREEDGDRE